MVRSYVSGVMGWASVLAAACVFALASQGAAPEKAGMDANLQKRFGELRTKNWKPAFSDSGAGDWRQHWFLDGERAAVTNTEAGMVFAAGPVAGDDASHAVLWTRQSFRGDVMVEWDFTRLDTINRYVNIIYIQATGIGTPPYTRDIAEWSSLRQTPFMKSYFNYMNLLHISYAAFGNDDDLPDDYVRARRYPTLPGRPFSKTDIAPDNFNTGLFLPGENYHFTFIKTDADLFFVVRDGHGKARLFHWPLSGVEPLVEGRIGIRHMATRCSRYRDIRIATRDVR
ncbi:MAG: hypothetical protein LBK99_16675 [Opitutaceae bacterium]|nr:hypothetical protein [Opitutaceae bacterium]